jgi:hypothetical protein
VFGVLQISSLRDACRSARLRMERYEAFAECPQCGACDGVNATRCVEDGTPLVRVSTPRVLGGRYTIRRRLGRGGMGTVYEAHDGALERCVAVKVIRDDIIGSPDAAERFRREALVAASFAHPNGSDTCRLNRFAVARQTRHGTSGRSQSSRTRCWQADARLRTRAHSIRFPRWPREPGFA